MKTYSLFEVSEKGNPVYHLENVDKQQLITYCKDKLEEWNGLHLIIWEEKRTIFLSNWLVEQL